MAGNKYDVWREQALKAIGAMSPEAIKKELLKPKYREIQQAIEDFESADATHDATEWVDSSIWGQPVFGTVCGAQLGSEEVLGNIMAAREADALPCSELAA